MAYRVQLTAQALVKTSVIVDIDVDVQSEAEAIERALEVAKSGDALWEYDGVNDATIRVVSTNPQ